MYLFVTSLYLDSLMSRVEIKLDTSARHRARVRASPEGVWLRQSSL